MTTTSRFAFLAAVVATGGISSPVLAAPGDWPDGRNGYGMVTRDGWTAYAMVPHDEDSNSSVFTGAGSSGYNAGEKIH